MIAVDFQAHGRTNDIDRPLTIPDLTADIVAVLSQLGLSQVDVFGFSVGGAVALTLAVEHPQLVRKAIISSTSFARDGDRGGNAEVVSEMKVDMLAGTPMEQVYLAKSPHPDHEHLQTLLDKLGRIAELSPEWSEDDIRGIAAPTLITVGDSDVDRGPDAHRRRAAVAPRVVGHEREPGRGALGAAAAVVRPGARVLDVELDAGGGQADAAPGLLAQRPLGRRAGGVDGDAVERVVLLVGRLQAVHDRPALGRDAAAHGVHARVGERPARRQRERQGAARRRPATPARRWRSRAPRGWPSSVAPVAHAGTRSASVRGRSSLAPTRTTTSPDHG